MRTMAHYKILTDLSLGIVTFNLIHVKYTLLMHNNKVANLLLILNINKNEIEHDQILASKLHNYIVVTSLTKTVVSIKLQSWSSSLGQS